MEEARFRFSVLGRYQRDPDDNVPHVTVSLIAGEGAHLTYCGTLTMSEWEWTVLVDALRSSLGEQVEIEDRRDRGRSSDS